MLTINRAGSVSKTSDTWGSIDTYPQLASIDSIDTWYRYHASSDILIVAGLFNPILKLIRKSVGLTNPKKHVIFKKPTFSKNPHFQKTRPFKHSDVIGDLTLES